MPAITFISVDGERRTVAAECGGSVMEAAVGNGVPGIDADCGGSCACATCHVIVGDAWFDKLPAPSEAERDMLEFAVNPQEHSRLACQIVVTDDLDGLIVQTPESQR